MAGVEGAMGSVLLVNNGGGEIEGNQISRAGICKDNQQTKSSRWRVLLYSPVG